MIDINADFFDSKEPTETNTSHFVKVGREQSIQRSTALTLIERFSIFIALLFIPPLLYSVIRNCGEKRNLDINS